jgi:predicted metalloenzyme YecM
MSQMDIEEFLKLPTTLRELTLPLISQVDVFCEEQGLVGLVEADHICMRCSSSTVYEARRADFEGKSTFIYQSVISDRRIGVIGLAEAIPTTVGNIKYLELADQKPDNSQIDRIDHIEMVPTGITYDELVSKLKANGVELSETVRPHHTTHEIRLPSGFEIRLSREMLIEKVKREEMN